MASSTVRVISVKSTKKESVSEPVTNKGRQYDKTWVRLKGNLRSHLRAFGVTVSEEAAVIPLKDPKLRIYGNLNTWNMKRINVDTVYPSMKRLQLKSFPI